MFILYLMPDCIYWQMSLICSTENTTFLHTLHLDKYEILTNNPPYDIDLLSKLFHPSVHFILSSGLTFLLWIYFYNNKKSSKLLFVSVQPHILIFQVNSQLEKKEKERKYISSYYFCFKMISLLWHISMTHLKLYCTWNIILLEKNGIIVAYILSITPICFIFLFK